MGGGNAKGFGLTGWIEVGRVHVRVLPAAHSRDQKNGVFRVPVTLTDDAKERNKRSKQNYYTSFISTSFFEALLPCSHAFICFLSSMQPITHFTTRYTRIRMRRKEAMTFITLEPGVNGIQHTYDYPAPWWERLLWAVEPRNHGYQRIR